MQSQKIFGFKATLLRLFGVTPRHAKAFSITSACIHKMQENEIDNFTIAHALHAAAFQLLLDYEDAEECLHFAKFSREYSEMVQAESQEKLAERIG